MLRTVQARQKCLGDIVRRDGLVFFSNLDKECLGLVFNIANVDPAFMGEQDGVVVSFGVDTDVTLFTL